MCGTPYVSQVIVTPGFGVSTFATWSGGTSKPSDLKYLDRSADLIWDGVRRPRASYISHWFAKLWGAFLPSTASRSTGSPASTVARSVAVTVPDWPGGMTLSTSP